MNDINKKYILSLLEKNIRIDKRKPDEYREIKIETGVSSKSAEGSARVKIGDTEVIAGVKLDVGTPYPDTLDEGSLMVNMELLPLSSPDFESGPPSINSIELSRVIDRGIRESKMIDMKKLCIKKGEKIWLLFVDIYPINDDGNLFDAAALAAIAALKDAKFPKYDTKTECVVYEKTDKPLPITKTPISCTICKIGKQYIVDPTLEEENATDVRLTIGVHNDKIHAMQKGKEKTLNNEDIENMVELAIKKSKELLKLIK